MFSTNFISMVASGTERIPTFTFTVNTNSAGASGIGKFQLPLVSSGTIDFDVDWGDGTSDNITVFNQPERIHTYPTPGIYTISITGNLRGWRFGSLSGEAGKMGNVSSWGALTVSTDEAFHFCGSMTCTATDAPTIATTTFARMFRACSAFNAPIGNWNVSGVSNFFACFVFSPNFNGNIGTWNTSSATSMQNMFGGCTAFNQDIGSWNVSNVTNFNGFMFSKTNLNYSAANLDSIYNGWSSRPVVASRTIDFNTIKYTAAGQAGRDILTGAPNLWSITDGGI